MSATFNAGVVSTTLRLIDEHSPAMAKIAASTEKALNAISSQYTGLGRSSQTLAGHQQRLNRIFEEFSGDKTIQTANEYAQAVGKVGGASRLTSAEQAKVNAAVNEGIAKYTALGQKAPQSMVDLANATAKVAPQMSMASKAAGFLSSTFAQFTAANLAANALLSLASSVGQFVTQGMNLRNVESSFRRLSAGVKQDSRAMVAAMSVGTRGLVSNYDLMLSANKAMLLGLPVTSQSMGELSTAATVLGRAMGLDATKSLDDMITGLGRQSPMLLDNLGITVDAVAANEEYARALGKTASELTDAERNLAFYNATLKAARQAVKELGDQTFTLGELATKAWTAIGNQVTSTASFWNNSLGSMLSSWKNFSQFTEDARRVGVGLALVLADQRTQAAAAAAEQKKHNDEQNRGAFVVRNYAKELKDATVLMPVLTAEGRKQYEAAVKLGLTQEQLTEEFGLSAVQQKLYAESLKAGTEASKRAKDAASALVERVEKQEEAHHKNRLALFKTQNQLTETIAKTREALPVLTDYVINLRTWKQEQDHLNKSLEMFHIRLKQQAAIMGEQATAETERMSGALQVAEERLQRADDELRGFVSSLGQLAYHLGDNKFGRFVEELYVIGDAWMQAKDAADAYAKATTLAGKAMAVVQGISAVAQATSSKNRTMAVGGGALAGAQAGMMFGPYGAAVGAVAGAIVGFIRTANQGRKAVEEFAKSFGGFDALHEKLNELGDEGERLWVTLTQGVGNGNPQQAAAAIEAINAALEKQKNKQEEAAEAAKETADTIIATQKAAAEKVVERINGLTREYDRLWQSIADEAPEEVMGVIEQQTRARMAALAEERDAAETELQGMAEALGSAWDEVIGKLDEFIDRLGDLASMPPITVPVQFPGGTAPNVPGDVPLPNPTTSGAHNSVTVTSQVVVDGKVLAESLAREVLV